MAQGLKCMWRELSGFQLYEHPAQEEIYVSSLSIQGMLSNLCNYFKTLLTVKKDR